MVSNGQKRALFYSHDTIGLGHLRRTMLICEGLRSRFEELSTLIVTGSAMAHAFRMPKGVDYVKLPSVFKIDNERYKSRFLRIPFREIRKLRQQIVLQTTKLYAPDFFFVDNVPLGMKKELLPTLRHIRSHLPRTRVFLILRDILDDRRIVYFWKRSGTYRVLHRYYDRIFVIGSSSIFDLVKEYRFPKAIEAKTRFCGYIPRPTREESGAELRKKLCPQGEKLVLVTLGGGSDGTEVVANYLKALPRISQQVPLVSVILLGPDMDRAHARRLIARHRTNTSVTFLNFCNDPLPYIAAADIVISMAGHNTISEIVWLGKKAIVVPRIHPRREQLIRSRLLHERRLVRMIHPNELNAGHLAREIILRLEGSNDVPKEQMNFTAIERLASELQPFMQGQNASRQGGFYP